MSKEIILSHSVSETEWVCMSEVINDQHLYHYIVTYIYATDKGQQLSSSNFQETVMEWYLQMSEKKGIWSTNIRLLSTFIHKSK